MFKCFKCVESFSIKNRRHNSNVSVCLGRHSHTQISWPICGDQCERSCKWFTFFSIVSAHCLLIPFLILYFGSLSTQIAVSAAAAAAAPTMTAIVSCTSLIYALMLYKSNENSTFLCLCTCIGISTLVHITIFMALFGLHCIVDECLFVQQVVNGKMQ